MKTICKRLSQHVENSYILFKEFNNNPHLFTGPPLFRAFFPVGTGWGRFRLPLRPPSGHTHVADSFLY